jgi:hypothetical protein
MNVQALLFFLTGNAAPDSTPLNPNVEALAGERGRELKHGLARSLVECGEIAADHALPLIKAD